MLLRCFFHDGLPGSGLCAGARPRVKAIKARASGAKHRKHVPPKCGIFSEPSTELPRPNAKEQARACQCVQAHAS
eukprot:3248908-Alexandrium_andersonii.AAC.1